MRLHVPSDPRLSYAITESSSQYSKNRNTNREETMNQRTTSSGKLKGTTYM